MTALIVILAVILVIFLILMIPAGFIIKWHGGFFLSLKILFVKIRIIPKKEKKIRLRNYSKKNFEKMLERERRAAEKRKIKRKKSQPDEEDIRRQKKQDKREKHELLAVLYKLRYTVGRIVKAFAGHIRTDVVRADIAIGAEDAASCALLYGAASQFCAYILEFLEGATKMRTKKRALSVRADFDAEKTEADIEICFSIRLIHILAAFVKLGLAYFDFAENENK